MGSSVISINPQQSSNLGASGVAASAWTRAEKIRTAISFGVIATLLLIAFILSSNTSNSTAPISLLIGISLGLLLERGRFCFFCIFRDGIEDKNTTPLLSVLVAIATGSVGYSLIFGQFLPDTSTDRLPPAAHIGPVSWVLALSAFTFGIGMALSGACISGHLYRLGQGYLRAIPALIGTLGGFVLAFLHGIGSTSTQFPMHQLFGCRITSAIPALSFLLLLYFLHSPFLSFAKECIQSRFAVRQALFR